MKPENDAESRASDAVQAAIQRRISDYPERARLNMHRVRVRVPVRVAQVLKHWPGLISLAVESFYDRDLDSMKYAAKMERFGGREEEMVTVAVTMSRAMYAQLVRQNFQAPKCYAMPGREEGGGGAVEYAEAELGMKIACGFEMMYQERRRDGLEGKGGSTWETYRESLERSGYFEGELPGSKEYRRRLESAMDYYKKSNVFAQLSEMMNAPVKQIDEILALPHSVDDFKALDLPPSDDDSWLYSGEDELNSAILERQKEIETYESKRRRSKSSREHKGTNHSSNAQLEDFDLGDIAKSMQEFVHKVSSYEGAELPKNRDLNEVEIEPERFIKDLESILGHVGHEGTSCGGDVNGNDTSSSDMDFDESEDESDPDDELDGDNDTFMNSYSDALNKELKTSTLKKSFIRANEQDFMNNNEGTSSASKDMDEEELTPVDVDVNLVKSLLDSFSSQQGLPGPGSNLLGLMGLELPRDTTKGK